MEWKIEVVVMPVSDLDRAKAFYADQVGFNVDHDTQVNDQMRIIQLTPSGSGCSIVIGTGLTETAPGAIQGIQLVVSDIDAAQAQLVERGVEATPVRHVDENGAWVDGKGGPWNSFVFFSDPDGNGWSIQERPADA